MRVSEKERGSLWLSQMTRERFKTRHFREEDGEGAESGNEMQEIPMEQEKW